MATVVIKRLRDAMATGDPVRAVIRETYLNQDGKSETITSPSQVAQEALMRECYRRAGLDPCGTQYFEAHGTGTPMGDPIEARAVAAVFRHGREKEQALRIGSVKTNIGHTETTSGLAGIIKVVLALENGVIPPSINFQTPNPKLNLDEWRLKVATELEPWPQVATGEARRASLNNFGYGGTNSHVILESADAWLTPVDAGTNGNVKHATKLANGHASADSAQEAPEYESKVIILSARDEQACQRMVSNLKEYLQQKSSTAGICSELLLQRLALHSVNAARHFRGLPCILCRTPVASMPSLRLCESPGFRVTRTSRCPRIGLVFTGKVRSGTPWDASWLLHIPSSGPRSKRLRGTYANLEPSGRFSRSCRATHPARV